MHSPLLALRDGAVQSQQYLFPYRRVVLPARQGFVLPAEVLTEQPDCVRAALAAVPHDWHHRLAARLYLKR
ncbi:hypothetical protein D3C81_2265580 [compost metagenome]